MYPQMKSHLNDRLKHLTGGINLVAHNGRSTNAQMEAKAMFLTYMHGQYYHKELMRLLGIKQKIRYESILNYHQNLISYDKPYQAKYKQFKRMETITTPSFKIEIGHVLACDENHNPLSLTDYDESCQTLKWGIVTDIYELNTSITELFELNTPTLNISIQFSKEGNRHKVEETFLKVLTPDDYIRLPLKALPAGHIEGKPHYRYSTLLGAIFQDNDNDTSV